MDKKHSIQAKIIVTILLNFVLQIKLPDRKLSLLNNNILIKQRVKIMSQNVSILA
jgi:hypothetical protein